MPLAHGVVHGACPVPPLVHGVTGAPGRGGRLPRCAPRAARQCMCMCVCMLLVCACAPYATFHGALHGAPSLHSARCTARCVMWRRLLRKLVRPCARARRRRSALPRPAASIALRLGARGRRRRWRWRLCRGAAPSRRASPLGVPGGAAVGSVPSSDLPGRAVVWPRRQLLPVAPRARRRAGRAGRTRCRHAGRRRRD